MKKVHGIMEMTVTASLAAMVLSLLIATMASASTLSFSRAQEEEAAMKERPKMFVDYLNGPLKGKTRYKKA
jgi:hypothetical protein